MNDSRPEGFSGSQLGSQAPRLHPGSAPVRSLGLGIFLAALSSSIQGQALISPDALEWMAQTSVDVARMDEEYDILTATLKPNYMVVADGAWPAWGREFPAPTTDGIRQFGFIQGHGIVYLGFDIGRDYGLAAKMVGSAMRLESNTDSYPDFIHRDIIVQCQVRNRTGGFGLTLGPLFRTVPHVATDESGAKVFAPDPESYTSMQLLFGANYRALRLGTYYDFLARSIKLLHLGAGVPIAPRLGVFRPGVNYYRLRRTVEVGFAHTGLRPLSFIALGLETYLDVGHLQPGCLVPSLTIDPFWTPPSELPGGKSGEPKRRLRITLELGGSYSRDILQEDVFGYAVKLNLEGISWPTGPCCGLIQGLSLPSTVAVRIGLSRNYHRDLLRMPIRDVAVFLLECRQTIP